MEARSVEAILRVLNEAGVRYVIVGGFAVNAHGYVRFTSDIDIVISLQANNILSGLKALFSISFRPAIPISPEDFANPEIREIWRVEKEMKVLRLWSDVHQRTPIDIFVFEPFDFESEYQKIKVLELSPGIKAPIVGLETLLAMKRAVGRPLDLVDVAALEDLTRLEHTSSDDQAFD